MTRFDVAIVGAGMAGASLAAELAPHASVLVLEAEPQPGYHSTGRSAAFWEESYGGVGVQPLTSASRDLLATPPTDFAERSFLSPRGALHLAGREGQAALDRFLTDFADTPVDHTLLDEAGVRALVPQLRDGPWRGVLEASTADIDVGALHAAYLRAARRCGVAIVCDAPLAAAERRGSGWRINAGGETYAADLLVDAAGAWADRVAVMAGAAPLGIRPLRRTLSQLRVAPQAPAEMPLVMDARGLFYVKAEGGGRLWLSPHDEVPSEPCDAAPEEIDVATAIDRFGQAFDWPIARVERSWAGLRSFAPDRLPVYGFDARVPGFFWFAGQGGFGIQTAPAAARLAEALVLGTTPHASLAAVDIDRYAPNRFSSSSSRT